MSKKKPANCPFHEGTGWPERCEPETCTILGEARILEDRLEAIEMLVGQARHGLMEGSDGLGGLSLTACLEAARVLAHSITRDDDLKVKGQDRVLWTVLSAERMGRAGEPNLRDKEPAPPSLRAVPGIK